jgi:hypothetical protein
MSNSSLQRVRLQASCSVPNGERPLSNPASWITILTVAFSPSPSSHLPMVLKIAPERYCRQLIGCQVANMRDVCLEMCVCLRRSPLVGVAQQDILKKRMTPIQLLMKCISFAPPFLSSAAVLFVLHPQSHIGRYTTRESPS